MRALAIAGAVAAALGGAPVAAQQTAPRLIPAPGVGSVASLVTPQLPARPFMLPDGEVSLGSGAIRYAWLMHPTTRYDHGVIGDAIEASGIAVETNSHDVFTMTVGADAVIEDRLARIVRIDGTDGVLVVKSYLERGAALAFATLGAGRLHIAAESPAIGQAHRWLNPVGVADFDGDGRDEVAAVLTPHIGGILVLYERHGSELREKYRAAGFSNHAIGTRELGWSAILDADRDGTPDIVIPDSTRGALRIVTFAAGRFLEIGRVALPAGLRSSFVVAAPRLADRPALHLELADGRTYVLRLGP